MRLNAQMMTAVTLVSTLASALPLDKRDIVPRNKSYQVVNVSGSSTSAPAPQVVIATQTVEVIIPGPTGGAPAITTNSTASTTSNSASTSSTPCSTSASSTRASSTSVSSTIASSTSTPSPSATPVETPKPAVIIVTVPADDGPYYDDGMWHTRYRVKTFAAAAVAAPSAAAS